MRDLQKPKRVSWASDVKLCQVRLFLSEDFPSQVGLSAQDNLQAKEASWMLHSTGTGSDDNLPPGFEGSHPSNQWQSQLSDIPLIKWKCPPRFVLNITWRAVAGEESKEVEVQNQREMRVLEAVYPRPSSIPPNSSVAMDVDDSYHDDRQTPVIPITPIEDEDAATDSMAPMNLPISSQPLAAHHFGTSSVPNPISNERPVVEQGNLIDRELLEKIFRDPKLLEKLITDCGAASNLQTILKPVMLSDPSPIHINRAETSPPLSGPFYSQPNAMGPVPSRPAPPPRVVPTSSSTSGGAPLAKDINYYKSLIQQHGGDRQHQNPQFGGSQESINNKRPRDSKPKKPCFYFNSPKGCRLGTNCTFQHDASRGSSMPEVQSTKRMKMDREITGT